LNHDNPKSTLRGFLMSEQEVEVVLDQRDDAQAEPKVEELSLEQLARVGGGGGTGSWS